MSEQYSTQAELDAQPDRVAARRLIASYQPQSADASNVLDTLCLHTDVWITWHELLAAASSRVSDIEKLAELSEAILRTAATAGVREEAVGEFEEVTWSDYHIETLLMESRESYEKYFHWGKQVIFAEKRNLMAYFARLSVAGTTACEVYFFDQFADLLGPLEDELFPETDVEDLVMIADYFRIAGVWMQARNTNEYWAEGLTSTEERWKLWKRGFRMLAERSDSTVRAYVDDILRAMS